MKDDDVTGLLRRWRDGDKDAADALFPLVYDQLKRLGRRAFQGAEQHHTLDVTGLVNEAYLRMIPGPAPAAENRAHFFSLAGRVLRQVVVDHYRRKVSAKRGGDWVKVTLTGLVLPAAAPDVLDLDAALQALEEEDAVCVRIVELRFYAGMTTDETAEALRIGRTTVTRKWQFARSWLHRHLTKKTGRGPGVQALPTG